jgi:murein DD-endopeptidase MepM/ murein hydrolase activator NlpD
MPLCQPDRGERMGKINSPYALAVLIFFMSFSVVSCSQPYIQKDQSPGVYHLVKKNETLQIIAQAYGISQQDLLRANHLKDIKSVKPGSVIFVPNATRAIDIHVKPVPATSDAGKWKYTSGGVKEQANKEIKEIKEVNKAKDIKETKNSGEAKDVKDAKEIKEVKKEVQDVQEKETKEKTEVKKDAQDVKAKEVQTAAEAPVAAPAAVPNEEVVPVLRIAKAQPPQYSFYGEKTPQKTIPDKKYPDKKTESKPAVREPIEKENIKPDKNRFVWPVAGSVNEKFGVQPNKTYNNWIKIVSKPGAKIKAAANGTVIFSSFLKNYGETIIIRHRDNFATVYTHLKKRYVKIDKDVKKGETIALLGEKDATGKVYMNFEIRIKGKARNPMLFLP